MAPSSPSSFSDSLERSAQQQRLHRWQAAQTVRAHVAVEDGLDAMLECLGLADAERP